MKIFRFGEHTLDVGSRLLVCDGEVRHLSPKAQHLLRLLIAARPNAVSRQELFDKLWPSTFVADTNLPCLVNEVRRALGDDPREPRFIRTVHGFGYAFHGAVAEETRAAGVAATLLCEDRSFLLPEGEHIVGRAADAHVVLTHSTVSRYHARLSIRGCGIAIEDLGSKNGTFVDGRRVEEPHPLHRHSRIAIAALPASIVPGTVSGTVTIQVDLHAVREQVAALQTS